MSGLSEYQIPAPGGQTITVQLLEADAKAYGDAAVAVKAKAPANKAKAPANKAKAGE